jgi:hypothetical protein
LSDFSLILQKDLIPYTLRAAEESFTVLTNSGKNRGYFSHLVSPRLLSLSPVKGDEEVESVEWQRN